MTSAERGSQLTIGVFINILGNALPPVCILPSRLERSRKRTIFDLCGNLIGALSIVSHAFSTTDG